MARKDGYFIDNNVREVRESLSKTQAWLADACHASQGTISQIEAGRIPSVTLALRISKALRVPVTDLFIV